MNPLKPLIFNTTIKPRRCCYENEMFLILVAILNVSACGQKTLNEEHKVFLFNKGWLIKKSIEVETYILDIPNEMLSNYEASGIAFLSEYLGEEVTQYSYELKEEDVEGKRLKAVVFEAEEIIGGYGILPSWTPGTFNLDDKERLINDQMIKQ
ncbi:DUF4830 domain-containing protein [Bacillus sp. FJAT-49732]|uniref:DUF4830 domain-containing protein n=1 Tax=Lederbergia citrisecunda TaxID=2833583 RepID=A0A942TM04_9BACI|nr:DUF4830 domain-containing protein [Lederbergia citrisecunda]MBS4199152.1 DUF4830 domain-containing protein [Lederbergia citrisecunda]